MKTLNTIATALCLTALTALAACGGGQPEADAPDDKEGVAEEAMDELDESIEDVEEDVEDAGDDLE